MTKAKTTRAPRKPTAAKPTAAPATAPAADAGVTGDGSGAALPPATDTGNQEFQSANGAEAKPEGAAASSGGVEAKASEGQGTAAGAADPGGTSGAPTAPGAESREPASGASADRKDAPGVEKQPEDAVQPPVVGSDNALPPVVTDTLELLIDERLAEFTLPGVEVTGPKRGRRRAGRQFGADPVRIPLDELEPDDLLAINLDPALSWSIVELADVEG